MQNYLAAREDILNINKVSHRFWFTNQLFLSWNEKRGMKPNKWSSWTAVSSKEFWEANTFWILSILRYLVKLEQLQNILLGRVRSTWVSMECYVLHLGPIHFLHFNGMKPTFYKVFNLLIMKYILLQYIGNLSYVTLLSLFPINPDYEFGEKTFHRKLCNDNLSFIDSWQVGKYLKK